MTDPATVLDVLLAGALVAAAAAVVVTADLFKATVLFIAFGVMMSIAWGRLGAVDIALAEAAIGAGITGALLLHAQRPRAPAPARSGAGADAARERPLVRALAALVAALVAALLLYALAAAPARLEGLAPLLRPRLDEAGAENPVTAVLLNARAYDTLLEIVVLLAAVAAAWALALPAPGRSRPPENLLAASARVMVPVAVLIGGYLLWRGAAAPGGAFQAGAVIAGAALLSAFAGIELPRRGIGGPVRAGAAAGTLVFLAAGAYGPLRGAPYLHYRGHEAERWILVIEIAATLAIAIALVGVFMGRPPPGGERRAS